MRNKKVITSDLAPDFSPGKENKWALAQYPQINL